MSAFYYGPVSDAEAAVLASDPHYRRHDALCGMRQDVAPAQCPCRAPLVADIERVRRELRPRGGWLARIATNDLPPVAHGARAFVR